jgi:beta-aspartyl-peptidase (threonine type)
MTPRAILLPMRKLALILVAIAITLPSFAESSEQAITSLVTRQAEAWNRGDLEGFMDGYLRSDELVFTSGSRVRRGWQVTYDAYRKRYGTAKETMGKLTFSKLEVRMLGDDAAWVLGRWDLAGPKEASGGIFTLVLRQIDGTWLVVHDHTSADAAE